MLELNAFSDLEAVYHDAGEREIRTIVLYGHTDTYLYKDAAHTSGKEVDRATLLECISKFNVVIKNGAKTYFPIFFEDKSTTVEVTVATAISAGASAATVYKTKEPAA